MKFQGGFRYALEYREPVKGWSVRISGDDLQTVMKIYHAQTDRRDFRVLDRATETVITEAA